MTSVVRSFKLIYQLTEKVRRINLKIQKLFEKKIKQNELLFYKNLTERNLSAHQILILLTLYHASKANFYSTNSVDQRSLTQQLWIIYKNFFIQVTILSTIFTFSYYQKNSLRSSLIQNYDRLNDADSRKNYFVKQFYQLLIISVTVNCKSRSF